MTLTPRDDSPERSKDSRIWHWLKPAVLLSWLRWRPSRVVPVRIEGACRMTGNCCRNLILADAGRPVKTARQFRRLLRREPTYAMFEANEASAPDGWMRFHCSNLGADNRCTIHATRPDICRRYPQVEMFEKGGSLLAGCGYRLVREPRGVPFDRVLAAEMASGEHPGQRWGETTAPPQTDTGESEILSGPNNYAADSAKNGDLN